MRLTLRTDLITSCGKGMKNCARKKGSEIKHFFVWRALVATDGCDADCMVSYEPVLHGVSLCEPLDDLSDGWPLLTDGDVNAVKLLLLLTGIVKPEKVRSFKRGIGKSLKFQNKEKGQRILSNGKESSYEPLLVDDGVNSDGGLSSLTITNDQLTLATTDGHQGIDGLDTSLKHRGHAKIKR